MDEDRTTQAQRLLELANLRIMENPGANFNNLRDQNGNFHLVDVPNV